MKDFSENELLQYFPSNFVHSFPAVPEQKSSTVSRIVPASLLGRRAHGRIHQV